MNVSDEMDLSSPDARLTFERLAQETRLKQEESVRRKLYSELVRMVEARGFDAFDAIKEEILRTSPLDGTASVVTDEIAHNQAELQAREREFERTLADSPGAAVLFHTRHACGHAV
jgi:hypothetical protein